MTTARENSHDMNSDTGKLDSRKRLIYFRGTGLDRKAKLPSRQKRDQKISLRPFNSYMVAPSKSNHVLLKGSYYPNSRDAIPPR